MRRSVQNEPMARREGVVSLRRATLDDAPGIANVHVKSWQEAYRARLPQAYLESLDVAARQRWWASELAVLPRDRSPWLAEIDGEVIGFVAAGPSRDETDPPTTGEVQAIYVLPDCWALGVGRNLLAHAERDLAAHGYTEATLWVLADNDRARRFYETAGWRLDEGAIKLDTIGGQEVSEVRYRLVLGASRLSRAG
jgi:ribosomal protein S18 acetylase RimI-like enzyme